MPTTAVEFDPFSDEYFDDPTEVYRRLRDEAPVYFNEKYGFYALSRFADVVAAHRDWQTFSSSHGIELQSLTQDASLIKSLKMIIMMDPPDHDRLRIRDGRHIVDCVFLFAIQELKDDKDNAAQQQGPKHYGTVA